MIKKTMLHTFKTVEETIKKLNENSRLKTTTTQQHKKYLELLYQNDNLHAVSSLHVCNEII